MSVTQTDVSKYLRMLARLINLALTDSCKRRPCKDLLVPRRGRFSDFKLRWLLTPDENEVNNLEGVRQNGHP